MGKLNKDDKGFGGVELLLVIVIVVLLGVVGWYVYKNHNKTTTAKASTASQAKIANNSPSLTPTITPANPVVSSASKYNYSGWSTYTNPQVGFSIDIPPSMASSEGAPCTQVSYVYDNYGNKIPSSPTYIPTNGNVPVTVVGDGQKFYVAEEYTYQLTDKTSTADGHTLSGGCEKMITTIALLENSTTSGYLFESLPFQIVTVKNQQDILNWVQKEFNDTSITITSMTKDSTGNWLDVNLNSNNPMDFNFGFKLRYYQPENKLVYLVQGQSGHIQIPNNGTSVDGGVFYDGQIWDSFKLLN
jgi:Tfp pilus assembly protein PilE